MIERVKYNGYASVYMLFGGNFGQIMYIKQVDSLVGWDQAPWRGKREKNGEQEWVEKGTMRGKASILPLPYSIFFSSPCIPSRFLTGSFSAKIDNLITGLQLVYSTITTLNPLSNNNAAN